MIQPDAGGRLGALVFAVLLAVPPSALAGLDHLKCYKIADSLAKGWTYSAAVDDRFGSDGCRIGGTRLFCSASDKTAVVVTPPGGGPIGTTTGDFVCYKARCDFAPPDLLIEDQFGRRTIRFSRAGMMCAPAETNLPAPSVPTTTSSTLPPTACGAATAPQCDGACPERQLCQAFNTECVCRDVACGNPFALTLGCSGLCPPETPICTALASNECVGGASNGVACAVDANCPGGTCQSVTSRCFLGSNDLQPCTFPEDCPGGICVPEDCGHCVAGATPCGSAAAPMCDGVCPEGKACTPLGHACICFDLSCGSGGTFSPGAPQCWGVCPPQAPICRDIGGSCQCSPS